MVKQLNIKKKKKKFFFQTWRQKKLRGSDNFWPLFLKNKMKNCFWWNDEIQPMKAEIKIDLSYAEAAQIKQRGVSTEPI